VNGDSPPAAAALARVEATANLNRALAAAATEGPVGLFAGITRALAGRDPGPVIPGSAFDVMIFATGLWLYNRAAEDIARRCARDL
jgi:hypothetical protein